MASFADRVVGAMKLDAKTYEEVEADQTSMGQAMAVVVLAAVSAGIGAAGSLGMGGLVMMTIVSLVGWFIWAFLTYLIGTKVMPMPQTQADLGQLLRTIGFAAAPGLFGIVRIIPVIGWLLGLLVSLWQLAAMIVAVRQALDYTDTMRAVIVCVIGWIVYWIISVFLMLMVGGAAFLGSSMMSR
jgi:hypothetical protein